jgi:hypothetical protein
MTGSRKTPPTSPPEALGAEKFRRLKGERTGEDLIAAMQASPCREIEIEPTRQPMPVRDVEL